MIEINLYVKLEFSRLRSLHIRISSEPRYNKKKYIYIYIYRHMKEKMNDLEESLKKIFSPVIGLLDTIHVQTKSILRIVTIRKDI